MDTRSESGNPDGNDSPSTVQNTSPSSGNSDSNTKKHQTTPSSTTKCDRLLASLQDCVKKHPLQQETVCAHLHRAAGWCLIKSICPVQVDDLEGCIGVHQTSSKMPSGPPLVPDRCRHQAVKLEMCISAHQVDPN